MQPESSPTWDSAGRTGWFPAPFRLFLFCGHQEGPWFREEATGESKLGSGEAGGVGRGGARSGRGHLGREVRARAGLGSGWGGQAASHQGSGGWSGEGGSMHLGSTWSCYEECAGRRGWLVLPAPSAAWGLCPLPLYPESRFSFTP